MSSMAPTSAGAPHWVSEFGPRRWQRFLSYCTGWLATISWQSVIAVDCYIIAGVIQALIQVKNPTYEPLGWQVTLLTIAAAAASCTINVFAAGHLSYMESMFAVCHVFAFVPLVITLWVLAPKTAAVDVFVRFTSSGGWPSPRMSVLVGQVSSIFVCLGSDSVAHLAEEVEDAALLVPQAMIWSYLVNAPLAFILVLTLCFNLGSVEAALKSSSMFVWIFQNATQSVPATTCFTVVMLVLLAFVTVSAVASTSRQTFAFARDNGLPFSKFLKKVNGRFKVPANAIVVTAVFTAVLSLINTFSTVAFNAVLSLSTTGLMASYIISIGCVTRKRLRKEALPYARWSLGKAGLPVNCIALFYASWGFFWSFWPSYYAITAANFNWGSVIFLCLMAMACILYYFDEAKV